MSQQQFDVEVMQELYTLEQLQQLDGEQHNQNLDNKLQDFLEI